MKKVEKNIDLDLYSSKLWNMYFEGLKVMSFDIETTGLYPDSSFLMLSGMMSVDEHGGHIVQYFAEKQRDEKEIIRRTFDDLAKADVIVTFNGRRFDLPFLLQRTKKHRISGIPVLYNLDLYVILNHYSDLREHLPNLKQKTIEVFQGLSDSRDDQISGGESVDLYLDYLSSKDEEIEQQILLHNSDDVLQLYRLLPVIAKTDFHRAMYKTGFPAGTFHVEGIQLKAHELTVYGKQKGKPVNYQSFPTETKPYTLSKEKRTGEFSLTLPLVQQYGASYLDILPLLPDQDKIKRYPNYINGYLILRQNSTVNTMDINAFVLEFLKVLSVND